MNRNMLAAAPFALMLALPPGAHADPFPGADLAAGKEMHTRMCVECHERRFGGEDGSAIYLRPDRRVTTPSALSQQLTACTTMLNLDLFPEDEHHLAGYLNKLYYKFE
ncbi:MAG: cytochrome c [Thauera sp.]